MLVNRVYEFVNALLCIEDQLKPVDKRLLVAFQTKYFTHNTMVPKERDPHDVLSEQELHWIQERFSERWKEVADTQEDYTFDPSGQNVEWVRLARDLAQDLNEHPFIILMPVIHNKIDPFDFSRLKDIQDPRSIFLSNKGTWHRVKSLLQHAQQPEQDFVIFDQIKTSPRALTLKEMSRIRAKKREESSKKIDDEMHFNYWDDITQTVAPTWTKKGHCPLQLLPILLSLIENYFDAKTQEKDKAEFKKKFDELTKELDACSLHDINHFYGITLHGKSGPYYLIDVLLDFLHETEGLEEKLTDVAKWLCEFDPTLISQSKYLLPVYETLTLGRCFNVSHLVKLVSNLSLNVKQTHAKVNELTHVLRNKEVITDDIIQTIKDLYALRWRCIVDTPKDYLRNQDGDNCSWIHLARCLAAAGFIPKNYYQLLIPSLTQHADPITMENVINDPLSYFVLSEDEKELIYLPNCIKNHQVNGAFYCCSSSGRLRMLTRKEFSRLPFAAMQFYDYYLAFVFSEKKDLPISRRTVLALRDLVNGTLNPSALRLGHNITVDQEKIADAAYINFSAFIHALPSDEFARLYAHNVVWRGQKKQVAGIMAAIQNVSEDPKDHSAGRECIAVASQFFAKLVVDYDPDIRFAPHIEEASLASLDEMRLSSAKHVFRDWDYVSEEEALKRALTIVVSLMTHNFTCFWFSGVSLQMGAYSNTTTETGNELFKAIQSALELGDLSKIRFIYTYTMNQIVEKALAQTDLKTKYSRYEDTVSWLKSIKDESMFNAENSFCFEPKSILMVLVSSLTKNMNKGPIDNFLEKLIQMLLQPEKDHLRWLYVNIEFNKLLNSGALPPKLLEEILVSLRKAVAPVSEAVFLQQVSQFLIHRLSLLGISHHSVHGFFGINPGQQLIKKDVKECLNKRMDEWFSTLDSTQDNLIEKLFEALRDSIQQSVFSETHKMSLCEHLSSLKRQKTQLTDEVFITSFEAMYS